MVERDGAWGEPLAAVAVLVLAAVTEVLLLATGLASYTVLVALVLVAAGTVVGSRPSLLVVLATTWVGWGVCVVVRPPAPAGAGTWAGTWAVPLVGMVLATLLGGLVHLLRAAHRAELRQARTAVEVAAVSDPLTGCLNRRGLALLGRQIVETARRQGDAVHCLLLEVEGLRGVNESLGHRAGDEVLVAVAGVLRGATRGTDAVAPRDGDSFCVVGPGTGPGSLDLERRVRRDCR
ncbi:MAG: GGDEF domain-containing protein [Actinomycetota bacterium]|nr:GGDEF domain-containing protein [Actinomycetota bacterium]